MTIAPMKKERLKDYVEVFTRAFNAPPWNDGWTEVTAGIRLSQFMSTGTFFGLEMEEDGALIGFICGQREQYYDGPRFYIQEFCCVRQGGGYGTHLLEKLEDCLKREGVVRTYLMTIHGEATEGYYQRRGYVTDPEAIWMYKPM